MTRFARAKGSKSSNERVPENATPWNEMKRQLLEKNKEVQENKEREKAIKQRNENYKAFLAEKEESESKKTVWADFPGVNKNKKLNKHVKELKSKLKQAANIEKPQEKPKTMILNDPASDSDAPPEEISAKTEPQPEIVVKKSKKKKTPKKKVANGTKEPKEENGNTEPTTDENGDRILTEKDLYKIEKRKLKEKRHKERVKQKKRERKLENGGKEKIMGPLTEEAVKKIEKKKEKKLKQLERRKQKKAEEKQQNEHQQTPQNNNNTKPTKKRDNNEHERRKPRLPDTMFINGKTIEVEYVDGFPIRKEDALHLKQLRREMISKGLPRSEIAVAMKLERRKAEKAFAREKKRVCFNCRQSGHNLSECPRLNQDQIADSSGTGICFKCGSTEHPYFECRVVRGAEFRFATCFICNEQGHIAKQCPDNARGVYPKGGACNVCGDVTHLKKDCPKYQAEKQNEDTMNVGTIGFENPDDL